MNNLIKVVTAVVLMAPLVVTLTGCYNKSPPAPIASDEQYAFMKDCLTASRYVQCENRWNLLQAARK